MKEPSNVTELGRFLGMTNQLSRLILQTKQNAWVNFFRRKSFDMGCMLAKIQNLAFEDINSLLALYDFLTVKLLPIAQQMLQYRVRVLSSFKSAGWELQTCRGRWMP